LRYAEVFCHWASVVAVWVWDAPSRSEVTRSTVRPPPAPQPRVTSSKTRRSHVESGTLISREKTTARWGFGLPTRPESIAISTSSCARTAVVWAVAPDPQHRITNTAPAPT
jgi:hypothetical protein